MLTGVAKKMAGQFFAAVDADIAGVRAPARRRSPRGVAGRAGRAGGRLSRPSPVPPRPSTSPPQPAAAAAPSKDFLVGTLVGAAIALAGVAVGVIAGRR